MTTPKERKAFQWIHIYFEEDGDACGECKHKLVEYDNGFPCHSECEVNDAEDCPALPEKFKTGAK